MNRVRGPYWNVYARSFRTDMATKERGEEDERDQCVA